MQGRAHRVAVTTVVGMAHAKLPTWHAPQPSRRAVDGLGVALEVQVTDAEAGATVVRDGQAVGAIDGAIDARAHAMAVRITVDPDHRRQGVATAALRLLASLALSPPADGGLGLRRIGGAATSEHPAAAGLAKRLGVRREVRRRQARWVAPVGLVDELGWGVLAGEWDALAHRPKGLTEDHEVGVGPHPEPWPDDPHLDPDLLAGGDRRNVADRYRYWRMDAIRADLAATARPFHVAIENWRHDMNIGTVVRCANAFGARAVHVVGRRHWNRRGAMVTDRYLDVRHHPTVEDLTTWAAAEGLPIVGIDNLPGSVDLLATPLPAACVLLLGQEGPGLSAAAREAASMVLHIPQVGSTRSINAGVASGVAMAEWVRQHG